MTGPKRFEGDLPLRITDAERDEIITSYKLGKTIRRIMKDTGRSYGGVHLVLDKAGVKRRPRGKEKEDALGVTTPRIEQ